MNKIEKIQAYIAMSLFIMGVRFEWLCFLNISTGLFLGLAINSLLVGYLKGDLWNEK